MKPPNIRLNRNAKIKHGYIGVERAPLLLVDDFLDNVDCLNAAESICAAPIKDKTFYPGLRSHASKEYQFNLIAGLSRPLETHFGVSMADVKSIESYFSVVTLKPEDLSPFQRIPHFDFPLTQGLAAIHFLCDETFGGTSFYRHRDTRFEYIDESRFPVYKAKLEKELNSGNSSQGYITGSNALFEKIFSVPAKYNRLAIYRGSSLHSGDIDDSYRCDTPSKSSRLTVTSFIHFKS